MFFVLGGSDGILRVLPLLLTALPFGGGGGGLGPMRSFASV